jgi:hypothetical protein
MMQATTRLNSLAFAFALGLVSLAGVGCNKTQISEIDPVSLSSEKLPEPKRVLVTVFSVDGEAVKLDDGPLKKMLRRREIINPDDEEQELVNKLSHALAKGMVDQFNDAGYSASLVDTTGSARNGDLVITGNFTAIDAGSTAKRAIIGFGAGAAKVQAHTDVVYVKSGSDVRVMSFDSRGESNKKPGAVTTMGASTAIQAAGAAAGAASETGNNPQGVAHKSGRDLADKILADFPRLGWPANKNQPAQ